jgi:hypothetical protein
MICNRKDMYGWTNREITTGKQKHLANRRLSSVVRERTQIS